MQASKKLILKAYQDRLVHSIETVHSVLSLVYDSFVRHSPNQLDQAAARILELQDLITAMNESVVEETDRIGAKLLLALNGHLERVGACLETICGTVRRKTEEGVLFSGRALSELKHLFDATHNITRDVHDIVITRNATLSNHTIKACDKLGVSAQEYMTHHEERLVAGVCQPKNSAMYLDMVDNLRTVISHLREMVVKLGQ